MPFKILDASVELQAAPERDRGGDLEVDPAAIKDPLQFFVAEVEISRFEFRQTPGAQLADEKGKKSDA